MSAFPAMMRVRAFPLAFLLFILMIAVATPVAAQDHLLFCNHPERIRVAGAYADAPLIGGRTYTIFFHYRNIARDPGPFVIALQGAKGKRLNLRVRQGLADPQHNPPLAGRQAMARYLSAPERTYSGRGGAHFAYRLAHGQTASGIMTVRADSDARLRIYYKHDRWTVPHARVLEVESPRREVAVDLSADAVRQYYRIGEPSAGEDRRLDGTYGMLYAFKVAAPEGRRVRVSFSPRGGQAGMVGSINGAMRQTGIVPTARWKIFCEASVGKHGVVLTTAPFGGVFYPVELLFQLL